MNRITNTSHARCRTARVTHSLIEVLAAIIAVGGSGISVQAEIINVSGEFGGGTLVGQFDTSGVGSNVVDITFDGLPVEESRTLPALVAMHPILWNAAAREKPGYSNYWDKWHGTYNGYQWIPSDGMVFVSTTGTDMTYVLAGAVPTSAPQGLGPLLSYVEEWMPYDKGGDSRETACLGTAIFDDGMGGETVINILSYFNGAGPPFYDGHGTLTDVSIDPLGGDTWRFSWQGIMSPEPGTMMLLAIGLAPMRRTRRRS